MSVSIATKAARRTTTYPCSIIIYRIWFPNRPEEGYVGSTSKTMQERFEHHIKSSWNPRNDNMKLYQFIKTLDNGWDEVEVEELQRLDNCPSAKARYDEENCFINWMSATLNKNRPGAVLAFDGDQKLYKHHIYKTDEKERTRQAEKVKRELQDRWECDCGGRTSASNTSHHSRSKRHLEYLVREGLEMPKLDRSKRARYND